MVLANALSYHRRWHHSQWLVVAVALTKSAYPVTNREALYTTVTRAREEVVLAVVGSALSIAAVRTGAERLTGLQSLLAPQAERAAALEAEAV